MMLETVRSLPEVRSWAWEASTPPSPSREVNPTVWAYREAWGYSRV